MSHFTVMVRVPAETKLDNLEEVVGNMLVPFCEHENDGKTQPYFTFKDTEDEHRKEYETEGSEMTRLPDGALVSVYDNRVADIQRDIAHELGYQAHDLLFATNEVTDKIKAVFRERFEVKHVPYRERYATFEQFMKEWHGSERDEKTGRYGYWHNENRKWDWWTIGGRWRGKLLIKTSTRFSELEIDGYKKQPVEAGLGEVSWVFSEEYRKDKPVPGSETEVDFCRIRDLDSERIAAVAREKANEFWAEVDQLLSGKEFPPFEGPRDTLLDLGLLKCQDADELPPAPFWTKKWDRQLREGVDRFDVIAEKPSRENLDERVVSFMNPIRPYALLDANGWHACGQMGWFGCGSDTPESNEIFSKDFVTWLQSGNQADWLVMVDCHI